MHQSIGFAFTCIPHYNDQNITKRGMFFETNQIWRLENISFSFEKAKCFIWMGEVEELLCWYHFDSSVGETEKMDQYISVDVWDKMWKCFCGKKQS